MEPQHIVSVSMDFVADRLANGRAYRSLTLVDNVSKVSPSIEVDFALSGKRVVQVLDRAVALYGLPKAICVDNGSEFSGKDLDAWAYRNEVQLCFSRPGKPTDNAFIESFNGRFREECLNTHWFENLEEAQSAIESWRKEYNTERPHSSLGLKTPAQFAADWQPLEVATAVRNSTTGPENGCGSLRAGLMRSLVHKMGADHHYRLMLAIRALLSFVDVAVA